MSDFCEFSCTRGHKNWRKLKRLIFVKIHVPGVIKIEKNWSVWFLWKFMYGSWKLKRLIFVKIHVPGVMKIGEKWSVWFLWKFMYPGSWKLEKNEASDSCEILCTRGHENWKKMKCLILVSLILKVLRFQIWLHLTILKLFEKLLKCHLESKNVSNGQSKLLTH